MTGGAFKENIMVETGEGTIYFVRHGRTHSNAMRIYAGRSDEGLTAEGRRQAEEMAEAVCGWGVYAVYTSPIRRAVQTARILNSRIKKEIVVEERLTEIRMGPWEGMSEDEVAKSFPEEYNTWLKTPADLRLEGRETLDELRRRALEGVERILARTPGVPCLAVTHVAVIRCLYLHFNDLPLNLYKTIEVPNLSVFRLTSTDGCRKMVRIK